MVKFIAICLFLIPCVMVNAQSDPTRPQNYAPSKAQQNTTVEKTVQQPLTGIFFRDKKFFAIIEGKKYQVGETYRDSKLINITADKVVLRSDKGTYQLKLFEQIKK